MVKRCNDVGVRIYVDVVPNHMTASNNVPPGIGGSPYDPDGKLYPAVPYGPNDFHASCEIFDYNNADQVRNCELLGMKDLNHASAYVRSKIIEFLDTLVDCGVAGFRVDAAKHMWPADLKTIIDGVKTLNTDFGFPAGARPLFYLEVIDLGGEGISKYEYSDFARVTEFRYGAELGNAFRGNNPIKFLHNFGEEWGLLYDGDSLVFIDNHDNQRGMSAVLTFRDSKLYKMANAYMLAWPYGLPRVMSSYNFQVSDDGPPADANGNILGPNIQPDGTCGNGWICEHRWRQIFQMVAFRNDVAGTGANDWWDNGDKQIAFCRGGKGFIAFNDGDGDFKETLQTCLPAGKYCDVISGSNAGASCTGKTITVASNGQAYIEILSTEDDGVLAIHAQSATRAIRHPGSH